MLDNERYKIVQATDYYPFGLEFQKTTGENDYGFNSIELDKDLQVNTAMYRTYDPTLGRWWQVDPIVKFHESPYAGMANNPIAYYDYIGLDTTDTDDESILPEIVVVDTNLQPDKQSNDMKPKSQGQNQGNNKKGLGRRLAGFFRKLFKGGGSKLGKASSIPLLVIDPVSTGTGASPPAPTSGIEWSIDPETNDLNIRQNDLTYPTWTNEQKRAWELARNWYNGSTPSSRKGEDRYVYALYAKSQQYFCKSCLTPLPIPPSSKSIVDLNHRELYKYGIAINIGSFMQSMRYRYKADLANYYPVETAKLPYEKAKALEKVLIINYTLHSPQIITLGQRGITTLWDLPVGNAKFD
ncbi:MAG: RHS repeat-associated core domain-containing protein [Bacteroidota bacterium]